MDGLLLWVLIVAAAGWLTGKLIGETGYGEALGGYADGLDVVLGIVGASIGGYLFLAGASAEAGSFSRYATAFVGAVTLVATVRLVSERYLPSSSR